MDRLKLVEILMKPLTQEGFEKAMSEWADAEEKAEEKRLASLESKMQAIIDSKKAIIETLTMLISNMSKTHNISITRYTPPVSPFPPTVWGPPPQTDFFERCSCNPKNGGSGICGCIMNNPVIS